MFVVVFVVCHAYVFMYFFVSLLVSQGKSGPSNQFKPSLRLPFYVSISRGDFGLFIIFVFFSGFGADGFR